MSKFLTGARDRDGGRKARLSEKNQNDNTQDITDQDLHESVGDDC